jgi:uncharacterized Zn-binding protein involved in type VI secretion
MKSMTAMLLTRSVVLLLSQDGLRWPFESLGPNHEKAMTERPAAKKGDRIVASDTHLVEVPGQAPVALPHTFSGEISSDLSENVYIEGKQAAVAGSSARNQPPHIPTPPGTSILDEPDNVGRITSGSKTVFINGKPAARADDVASTCGYPNRNEKAIVVVTAAGSVIISS